MFKQRLLHVSTLYNCFIVTRTVSGAYRLSCVELYHIYHLYSGVRILKVNMVCPFSDQDILTS